MKPFTVADKLYDKDALIAFRQELIEIRDAALTNGNMGAAVHLSHNIGIFAKFIEEMET